MLKRALVIVLAVLFLLPLTPDGVRAEMPQPPRGQALSQVLADFDVYAEQARQDWGIPGMAVAVVQDGQVVYSKGFGVKELGGSDAVDENTAFQIGSASKAFASAVVASLVAEGKLKWDDRVVDYLPDFAMSDPWVTKEFTIEDLMSHRSGLPSHAGDQLYFLGYDRQQAVQALRGFQPVTSFRSSYAYQNILFTAVDPLLKAVTGKGWEENVKERVFGPLGMGATYVDQTSYLQAPNRALPHQLRDGEIVTLQADWPYHGWVDAAGPAGNINSSVADMARWVTMQLGGGSFGGKQVVGQEPLAYTHLPRTFVYTSKGAVSSYAMGWVYRSASPYPMVWHNGGTIGSRSWVGFVPGTGTGMVVLSNSDYDLPDLLGYRFYDMYFGLPATDYSALGLEAAKQSMEGDAAGRAEIDARQGASPSLPLASYAGSYRNDIYGTIEVTQEGPGLVISIGPKNTRLPLRPFGEATFIITLPQFSDYFGLAEFRVSDGGQVRGLMLDALGDETSGTFTRTGDISRLTITDLAPSDGATVPFGQEVTISAFIASESSAIDVDGVRVLMDGARVQVELHVGPRVLRVGFTETLVFDPGEHTMTVEVSNFDGDQATATVTFRAV